MNHSRVLSLEYFLCKINLAWASTNQQVEVTYWISCKSILKFARKWTQKILISCKNCDHKWWARSSNWYQNVEVSGIYHRHKFERNQWAWIMSLLYCACTVFIFITLQGLEPIFQIYGVPVLLLCPFVVSTSHMELSLSSAFDRFYATNEFWQCTAYDQTVQATSCCKMAIHYTVFPLLVDEDMVELVLFLHWDKYVSFSGTLYLHSPV